ncbi:MAG: 50S ribosomal protein L11 methyltransferase [Lachnospiraceae bacterium]|nr:50S ribosomal protein L11 methyltransferase [Lachnospiraceae bacterium]
MKWNKYTIKTVSDAEDMIISMLSDLEIEGAEIEDKVPLTEEEKKQMFVDILPDAPDDDGVAYVSFYLDDEIDNASKLEEVKTELENLRSFMIIGDGTISFSETEDKDWINNWKEFFKQFYIDDILIVPSWEEVKREDEEKMIIHIDPGTAFGTGMHETTQLCIRQLRKYVKEDTALLDIGTGSSILSIMALKFGAKSALGTDLDICAIDACKENMEVNGLANADFQLVIGNIIDDKEIQNKVGYQKYDVVVANILAEVLVPLTPVIKNHLKPGGIYITSGIIDDKEETVVNAVKKAGMEIEEITYQGEWVSVTAKLPE